MTQETLIPVQNVQRPDADDDIVFIDMADDERNPCLSCGACCNHFRVSFYQGELSTNLGGIVPAEMTVPITPFLACMKGTESGGGRCIALQGTPGQPGIGCAIYANRPTPCRQYPVWLEDGSPNPDCNRLRERIGLPPLGGNPDGARAA